MTSVRADLHVHTALSPCGGDEMTPPAIVEAALAAGLDMIAICDHNAAGNVRAVADAAESMARDGLGDAGAGRGARAAAGGRLTVLAGMEVTTAEEVHVVGLFPTPAAAVNAADEVGGSLPAAADGYTRFFGEQWLLDAEGRIRAEEPRALALATALGLEAAIALIKRYGGVAVAAHIDRSTFGVVTQLGFFPYDAGFDAVELSRHAAPDAAGTTLAEHRLPVLRSSDAHYLEDVGCVATELDLESASFDELALALSGRAGRSVTYA